MSGYIIYFPYTRSYLEKSYNFKFLLKNLTVAITNLNEVADSEFRLYCVLCYVDW